MQSPDHTTEQDLFTLCCISVAMVLYYDVTFPLSQDFGCVRDFHASVFWLHVDLWGSVHDMQRFDFLSAAEDCLLEKGAIRFVEHRLKLRYS